MSGRDAVTWEGWRRRFLGGQNDVSMARISGKYEVPTLEVKYLTSTQRILKERPAGHLNPPSPPCRKMESGGGWPDPGRRNKKIELPAPPGAAGPSLPPLIRGSRRLVFFPAAGRTRAEETRR